MEKWTIKDVLNTSVIIAAMREKCIKCVWAVICGGSSTSSRHHRLNRLQQQQNQKKMRITMVLKYENIREKCRRSLDRNCRLITLTFSRIGFNFACTIFAMAPRFWHHPIDGVMNNWMPHFDYKWKLLDMPMADLADEMRSLVMVSSATLTQNGSRCDRSIITDG